MLMMGITIYQNLLRWKLYISLMQYVVSQSCVTCDVTSLHMSAFDNKKVADFPLATYQDVQYLRQCTQKCLYNYKCRSYMFNGETGSCSTFTVGYSDPGNTYVDVVDESGDRLYAMCEKDGVFGSGCTSDGDCIFSNSKCRSSRCACRIGCSFEATSGHCVKYCATYGQFYDKYVNSGIAGCNVVISTEASVDTCTAKCINEASFVCVNIEFNAANSECQMCDTAWFDQDASDVHSNTDPGWTYSQRHCDV